MHRIPIPHIALAASLLLAGCGQAKPAVTTAPPTPPAVVTAKPQAPPVATNAVSIQNFDFSPSAITVPAGTTVTWTNKDVEQHTVTERNRLFNSDVIAGDKSFSFTFDKAGSYEYFCLIHRHMVGTVVVTDK
ncbi:MAG TPA: cupredoxin domain-containing protein [Chloroflexota bacterium]|nr:cupredoxin domain-containing protein [Chloroflexota bacterium]